MTSEENDIYWVFQEPDFNNNDIYLPPDTPIGKVNVKRLHTIYQKQHARQTNRLLLNQLCELHEYRRKFADEHKNDLFVKSTHTICQAINGLDFLNEKHDEIFGLLSSTTNNNGDTHHDSGAESDTSENTEATAEDMNSEEHSEITAASPEKAEDAVIEKHTKAFSRIMRKKFKVGFDELNKKHMSQFNELKKCQDDDVASVPIDIPSEPVSNKKEEDKGQDNNKKEEHGKEEQKKDSSKRVWHENEEEKNDTSKDNSKKRNDHNDPVNKNKKTRIGEGRPSIPIGPPQILSTSNNNNNNKVPPVVGSSRRSSDQPLFQSKTKKHKIKTLLDNGSLIIKSRPNTVYVNDNKGTVTPYGNPNDYDDAINGVVRLNNPISKRTLGGSQYLFHRAPSGKVTNIGLVSKIQPLVHKFLLST